jgi:hypothetical protein
LNPLLDAVHFWLWAERSLAVFGIRVIDDSTKEAK